MSTPSTVGPTVPSSSRSRRTSAAHSSVVDEWEPVNQVELVGRMSVDPSVRILPSGDEVVGLRVVVPRNDGRSDAFDCSAWTGSLRRKVQGWSEGDVVEIRGRLRRRFWRGASGPSSRWEIEISSARRVVRIGARRAG